MEEAELVNKEIIGDVPRLNYMNVDQLSTADSSEIKDERITPNTGHTSIIMNVPEPSIETDAVVCVSGTIITDTCNDRSHSIGMENADTLAIETSAGIIMRDDKGATDAEEVSSMNASNPTMENDADVIKDETMMSVEDEDSDPHIKKARTMKCEMCEEMLAKYCCPKCGIRSCSLACVKRHKSEYDCNGIRDRVGFVPLNSFNELNLLSDYRFLEETARCLDNAMRYPMKRGKYHNHKIPYWQFRMVTECKKHETCLLILPMNFQRRKMNTSLYDVKTHQMFWRVEWVFPQANVTLIDEKVSEHTTLGKALETYISPEPDKLDDFNKLCFYRSAGFLNIIPLMKAERIRNKESQYYELNFTKSIRHNLAKKTVVEFPTIILVLKDHINAFSIYENKAGEIESTDESEDDVRSVRLPRSKEKVPLLFFSAQYDDC